MVKVWSEEVADAKQALQDIISKIDPLVAVQVEGGEGLRNDTFELTLARGKRVVRCVVTFEALVDARKDPADLDSRLREVVRALGTAEGAAYIITTSGVRKQPASKSGQELRDIGASTEADVQGERFFRGKPST